LTAFAVDIIQYNAAVDYLNSLGIAIEDLSDYSHKEIKEAAKTIDAGESNPLTEETPTRETSEKIKEQTPTMPSSTPSIQTRRLPPKTRRIGTPRRLRRKALPTPSASDTALKPQTTPSATSPVGHPARKPRN